MQRRSNLSATTQAFFRLTVMFLVLASALAIGMAPTASAILPPTTTGSGTLTVDNNTTVCPEATGFVDFDSPVFFDVQQNETVHVNISPGFDICTAGSPSMLDARCTQNSQCDWKGTCSGSPGSKTCSNTGDPCTSSNQCTVAGSCTQSLECSGSTDVFVEGEDGNACSSDGDCSGTGETGCDTGTGLCKFTDTIPATVGEKISGQIDVCYTTRSNSCAEAKVAYCNSTTIANVNHPAHTPLFIDAEVRTVNSDDQVIDAASCSGSPATCTNQVGSLCCGLTQGAYGAKNSVATATASSCGTAGLGFIPAAACADCNVFASDPNATTIGIHNTKSVTIGPKGGGGGTFGTSPTDTSASFPSDLSTLIAYLPATGTAGSFSSLVGSDTHYASPSNIPDRIKSTSGSKGEGGGVLSGQTMSCGLNSFLSACTPPFGGSGTFTTSGFGGFTLPTAGTLLCTKRSGEDKVLGTNDDICQAFLYPNCVAGLTVSAIQAAANDQLGSGTNSLGCSATDLNLSLDNINNEFDQCGRVIDCSGQTTAGVFTCP